MSVGCLWMRHLLDLGRSATSRAAAEALWRDDLDRSEPNWPDVDKKAMRGRRWGGSNRTVKTVKKKFIFIF